MPDDRDPQTPDPLPGEAGGPLERLELTSPAFDDGDVLPARFAHDRENLSPPLEWSDVPPGTQELALLCQDPDAPSGLFTHWVLAGVDPTITAIDEGEVPPGSVAGLNDFGEARWGGPEPPRGHGPHRYVFRLCALDGELELGGGARAAEVDAAIRARWLAGAELVGTYERR